MGAPEAGPVAEGEVGTGADAGTGAKADDYYVFTFDFIFLGQNFSVDHFCDSIDLVLIWLI